MPDPAFWPATAREALLEIRRQIAEQHEDFKPTAEDLAKLDAVAELGLERREPVNFEMTDELGDRLAEAHKVLRRVDYEDLAPTLDLKADIQEALALPPQLEMVVERRIGPRS